MHNIGNSCNCKNEKVGKCVKHSYLFIVMLTIGCCICHCRDAHSKQATTYMLRGEVIDIQNHIRLSDVTIRIVDHDVTTKSNQYGQFKFDSVMKGQYKLEVTKVNYLLTELIVSVNESTPFLQIEMSTEAKQLDTVTVLEKRQSSDQYTKTTDISLDGDELEKNLGMTLAKSLSDQLGISQRTMGIGVARPVIRGMGGDRLLILEDGERSGDKSSSSADHAVAIDPTSAKGIEITRGPASLIYGSSTLGGVINVKRTSIPDYLPKNPTMRLSFQGESVNSGLTATTGVMVPVSDFVGNIEWNRRLTSSTNTPDGIIENTDLSNLNYTIGTSLIKPWGFVGLSGGNYQSDYGIPGSPEGHVQGVDITLNRQRYDGILEYRYNIGWLDRIKLRTAYTRYEHQELESNGSLGVEFGVLTYNFSVMTYLFDDIIAGLWGEYRDHATGGFYWTPHTREYALAGFYVNQYEIDRLTIQSAIRYDIRRAEPFKTGTVIQAGTVERRDFGGVSAAVSGIYHWYDHLITGGTIMKSYRAPGIEELFSDGPHLAVYSYEIGNAGLKDENGYGGEFFAEFTSDIFRVNVALFQNHIYSYLIPANTGQIEWGSGAAGWLWIYQYNGLDVVMNGVETSIETEILPELNLEVSMSYVDGTLKENRLPLESIPPLNGRLTLSYEVSSFHFHYTSRYSASQTRIGEFEEPTDGYIVHDAGCYFNFNLWHLENLIVFEAENILNITYRDHLSRIKSVKPEPGRNIKLLYKMNF